MSQISITYNTDSIPKVLEEILVKLRVIAMIPQNNKINLNTMSFVDSKSLIGAVQRSFHGEGRKGLVIQLGQIIAQAIQAISDYKETDLCGLIVNLLAESKIGINNLSSTYQDDPNICAQFDIIRRNIDIQLTKHKHLINGYTKSNV